MLKPKQAEEALQKFQIENGEELRRERVRQLPKELAEIGFALLECDPDGKPFNDYEVEQKAQRTAAIKLDDLPLADRLKLLEAYFPKLARGVEAAWQLQRQLPYQDDWERKGFRAPSNPALTRGTRQRLLNVLLESLKEYNEDVVWLATWAAHLGYGSDDFGFVLAGALNAGGTESDTIFKILCESAKGEHEIGGMGRHVTRALLVASRPDGWEFVEKLLLAAQRQEGLRQTILESIDEAHPEAFRRMLRLIEEHDLARFSATVRAVDTWFGFQWDSATTRVVNKAIAQTLQYLEDPDARNKALKKETGDALYLALWTIAFEDAEAAIKPASQLLKDSRVERRFVGVHLLTQLGLPAAAVELRGALEDDDLRIVMHALEHCATPSEEDEDESESGDLFERIERLLERLPEKDQKLKPLVWPWTGGKVDRKEVTGQLLNYLDKRPPTRLLPYLPQLDTWDRSRVVRLLAEMDKWDDATRETLFALVGDKSGQVRESAVEGLKKCQVTPDEAKQLEELLSRKANDLRRGVTTLLLNQPDSETLASAARLLEEGQAHKRLAGLELLRQMAETERSAQVCRQRAEEHRTQRSKLTEEEEKQIEAIIDTGRNIARLTDALGLMKPAERSLPTPPRKLNVAFITPAALACMESLDALIHEHRKTPITVKYLPDPDDPEDSPHESEPEPLGDMEYSFPSPNQEVPLEQDIVRLPLRDVWEKWWTDRSRELRDPDGCELLRALVSLGWDPEDWRESGKQSPEVKEALRTLFGGLKAKKLQYQSIVNDVLAWLMRLHPPAQATEFLLDAMETSFALVPPQELAYVPDDDDWYGDWRNYDSPFIVWLSQVREHQSLCPSEWKPAHHTRLWGLLRWFDEPGPKVARSRPNLNEVLAAYRAGAATEADLFDQLLGPREISEWGTSFDDLTQLTARKPARALIDNPALVPLVDRCRQRILEVELDRGESPTHASNAALSLQSVEGIDLLIHLLQALGDDHFIRGYAKDNRSKANVFSHLIKNCYPKKDETHQQFKAQTQAAGISEEQLLQLAFYAPQWVNHVEDALGWPQFTEGVWWFLAHTRDAGVDEDEDEGKWKATISERTALTQEELREGAVDVAWFQRTYEALGPEHWAALSEAAKFASSGQGYKRAQFLAEVMLGEAKKKNIISSVTKKRRREEVRALGLLPLATGKARDADVLERYHVFQEYLRYARQLSSMSRDSALRAAAIGVENLARTAGYANPIRLEWAMEARTSSDLAKGPITVGVSGVEVTLAIDALGQPAVTVQKKDKTLKNIPPAVKKNKKVADLLARRTELKRQASRVRQSLETMMCRGDTFTGAELQQLFDHPVLAPLLERVVVMGEGIIGYPTHRGKALRDHADKIEPVKKSETLRIAHPHDLLKTRKWHLWQKDCFARELIQPFKQVFRELYVLTDAEKADDKLSRRYAGQQVNPRQAMALWTSRGWVVSYDEGVRRTFHDANLTVHVSFLGGYLTPAEVEGLTLEGVHFTTRGEGKPIALTKVPPRLFSEVMRDLDLVVSVAHRGGVDPEASASTVEMRSALLRETCKLLKLANVQIEGSHVLVDGTLGNYSIHLGSAIVHRQPGGSLCLVPVHAQHRGRLFLPFADDDPKTAEVISKVIMLARDHEIMDPTVLDQLRASP